MTSSNLRKPNGLFRPARCIWSTLRYGLLMPIACGRRMLSERRVEDYSSYIDWINSKITDRFYHIRTLTDLAEGTSLLQLVDSCLRNQTKTARHGFVFGEMDDSYSLNLVKIRVALNIMESQGIVRKGEFSADLIASGDIEHIRGVVVKLALLPTTNYRTGIPPSETTQVSQGSKVTDVW